MPDYIAFLFITGYGATVTDGNRRQYSSVIKKELPDSGNLREFLSSGDTGTGMCITVINNLGVDCIVAEVQFLHV